MALGKRSELLELECSHPRLDVFVERGDALEYKVHVETSLGDGPARHRFRRPFEDRELKTLHGWAACSRGSERVWDSDTEPREQLREIGERLFRAVFDGEVLSRLRSALTAAREQDRLLVLRLRLRGDPQLAEWPWELLWDPRSRSHLALNQVMVSRIVEEVGGVSRSDAGRELRVLVVVASPQGQVDLEVEGELAQIEAAFAGAQPRPRVTIVPLRHATRRSLRELLKKSQFDVLHFIGHGRPTALLLEGECGRPDPASAEDLSGMFRGWPGPRSRRRSALPRLVVLNACDSARPPDSGRLDGLAQQLVRYGMPAVIAMAFPISDATALRFSEELYRQLAEGNTPEEALAAARNELAVLGHVTGWLAPVLYLHPQRSQPRPGDWPELSRPWSPWLAGASLTVLTGLGLWLWSGSLPVSLPPSDPVCPSPEGVELHFVKVTPGGGQKPFCIMATELTQGQYAELTGSAVKDPALPKGNLSYEDTLALTGGLNEKAGAPVYRLPTNAEWAFAAGSSRSGQANCSNPKLSDGHEGVAPVASFPANELGLFDMVGNVWEWVSDPPVDGVEKGVRLGGSFESAPENCHRSARSRSNADARRKDFGLRLVRDLETASRP